MAEKNTQSSTLLDEAAPGRRQSVEAIPGGVPQAKSGARETIISNDTIFEGKLTAKSEIRIEGTFKGEIYSDNRVIVGTAGKLEATVEAKAMSIAGRVVGNMRIEERLELLSTGEIYGDLETQPGALIIEKGARLEGRCSMGLGKAPKDDSRGVASSAPKPPSGGNA